MKKGTPSPFKGKKRPEISKGLMGHHVSEETKRKISEAKKGRKRSKKSIEKQRKSILFTKNPNFRHGRWSMVKYHDCCYLCKSENFLLVHHKDGNTNNHSKENMVVICKACHLFWHVHSEK